MRRQLLTAAFGLAAYFMASYLIFGNGLLAGVILVNLVTMPSYFGKPAIAGWICAPIALALSIAAARRAAKLGLTQLLLIPLIIFLWITLTAVMAGGVLEVWKARAVNAFHAERKYTESIFLSYREVHSGNFTYAHGAATRSCRPYIWSYATMSFHEIGPNTAVNVLPREWIEECAIQRVHTSTEVKLIP